MKSFYRGSRGTVFSKRVPLAAGGKREYEWAVLLLSGYFITPIRDSSRACVVSERSALKYSVRHKVLREKRIKKTFSLKSTTLRITPPQAKAFVDVSRVQGVKNYK
jgi:hypothetical protein